MPQSTLTQKVPTWIIEGLLSYKMDLIETHFIRYLNLNKQGIVCWKYKWIDTRSSTVTQLESPITRLIVSEGGIQGKILFLWTTPSLPSLKQHMNSLGIPIYLTTVYSTYPHSRSKENICYYRVRFTRKIIYIESL